MSWRTVFIGNPAHLSKKNEQLWIMQDEGNAGISFEDIAVVVLDHPQVTLTVPCLQSMAQHKVVLINCDPLHLPQGIFHSLYAHSRQLEVAQLQLGMSQPLKNRLWQAIVQRKIINQSAVIQDEQEQEFIRKLAQDVVSGDRRNTEAYAANWYFAALFSKSFHRSDQNNILNAALNYGYSIVRSAIARSVTAYGFLPFVGIHHRNKLNNFNLADDFIEPFRPLVDTAVYNHPPLPAESTLCKEYRHYLAGILGRTCCIDNKQHTLLTAIDLMTKHFRNAIEHKDAARLKLPVL